jgi:hypothetical protein
MNFIARPISQHHRARLIAWTLSMLLWTLQVLCGGAVFTSRHERQRHTRMSLDWLTRRVKLLIISRANDLSRLRMRRCRFDYRGRPNILKPGLVNALIGGRVRRALKRKVIVQRIIALIHALAHIDAYAALVAKRRLTRRWLHLFALPPAPPARLVALAAPDAVCADSS